MPRWLRLFTFNQINDFYQKENDKVKAEQKGSNTTNVMGPNGKINTKNIPTQQSKKSGVKYK